MNSKVVVFGTGSFAQLCTFILPMTAVYDEAKRKGYTLVSYISSKCNHWGDTLIGDNCFIFEDNTI